MFQKVWLPIENEHMEALSILNASLPLWALTGPQMQRHAHDELLAAVPDASAALDQARTLVARDRAVILCGVPVALDAILVATLSHFGTVSVQQDDDDPDGASLVWDVKPAQNMEGAPAASHGSKSQAVSPIHTDAIQVRPRNRFLALACVENSRDKGAATVVLPLDDVLTAVSADDRELLSQPVYTFAKNAHGILQASTMAILEQVKDETGAVLPAVRYSGKSLDIAFAAGHVPPAANLGALERFHQVVAQSAHTTEVWLEPGEMLVFDNARLLHGRGEIRGSERHLKRLRASTVAA
jgi:alpha-ketoglutarate-dependent taurine dioxygenase